MVFSVIVVCLLPVVSFVVVILFVCRLLFVECHVACCARVVCLFCLVGDVCFIVYTRRLVSGVCYAFVGVVVSYDNLYV